MMYFSCDICGKEMLPGTRQRYVVKMEIFAAHDPAEITEEDLQTDHLEAISQMIEEEENESELAPTYKKLRYDLCPTCHQRFLNDPLGREMQKFDFSSN